MHAIQVKMLITLLPMGEGAAKRRMRADPLGIAALTRPSATLSRWERDTISRSETSDFIPVHAIQVKMLITLLPMGEGAAKRRMRADPLGIAALTRPSATLSQWEGYNSQVGNLRGAESGTEERKAGQVRYWQSRFPLHVEQGDQGRAENAGRRR